jgi:hypothetical protein
VITRATLVTAVALLASMFHVKLVQHRLWLNSWLVFHVKLVEHRLWLNSWLVFHVEQVR